MFASWSVKMNDQPVLNSRSDPHRADLAPHLKNFGRRMDVNAE